MISRSGALEIEEGGEWVECELGVVGGGRERVKVGVWREGGVLRGGRGGWSGKRQEKGGVGGGRGKGGRREGPGFAQHVGYICSE